MYGVLVRTQNQFLLFFVLGPHRFILYSLLPPIYRIVGVVLYEMITFGSVPYIGMTNSEVIERIESGYRYVDDRFPYRYRN